MWGCVLGPATRGTWRIHPYSLHLYIARRSASLRRTPQFFLPPPQILPYWPNTRHLQSHINQSPLLFPAIFPLHYLNQNPYCNPVMEYLQDRHHFISNNPDFDPVQKHRMYCHLIHHWPALIVEHIFPITFANTPHILWEFLKLVYNNPQSLLFYVTALPR